MSDSDEEKSTDVSETIKAVGELVDKIPIYDDAVKPLALEVGKTLGTVGRTINAALSPVRGLVFGVEKIEEFIHHSMLEKLKSIPEQNIITPSIAIAGPALEALRFSGNDIYLREMYANLLANSMDVETAESAHPAFVEIVKQLTTQEAKLLVCLSKIEKYPDVCEVYESGSGSTWGDENRASLTHSSQQIVNIFCKVCEPFNLSMNFKSAYDNFKRLSILDIETATIQEYRPIEEWEFPYKERELGKISFIDDEDEKSDRKMTASFSIKNKLYFTSLGSAFIEICVRDKT